MIWARVKAEEQDVGSRGKPSPKSEDEGWEKVESHAVGTVKNGEKAEGDWEGIVGFFHPFWSASPLEGTELLL